jgi:serine/threonine protein kinase
VNGNPLKNNKVMKTCVILLDTNTGVGPVCWMAPKSISHRNYSKKSDVWTFGIVGL